MSMHTYVIGFKEPNEKWLKMKRVYDVCKKAGIDAPIAVDNFFGGESPDEKGVVMNLGGDHGVKEWDDMEMRGGYEVELSKLPKDLTHIRFVNSY